MANPQHEQLFRKSVISWNKWRQANPAIKPDLSGIIAEKMRLYDLEVENFGAGIIGSGDVWIDDIPMDLSHCNFKCAILKECSFEASLEGADFTEADLTSSYFRKCNLSNASFKDAILKDTGMTDCTLHNVNFENADLRSARIQLYSAKNVSFKNANLIGWDLTSTTGLTNCDLSGAQLSAKLLRHMQRSPFLKRMIDDFKEVIWVDDEINTSYCSCFISYSSKDDKFAKQLYADLRDHGVKCWFAPHHMPIGNMIQPDIHDAIRQHQKLLLILSTDSIESDWVEDETAVAIDEEVRRSQTVLFPIRLDNSILQTSKPWAASIRMQRHIGDFSDWKNSQLYRRSFAQLLNDLKA